MYGLAPFFKIVNQFQEFDGRKSRTKKYEHKRVPLSNFNQMLVQSNDNSFWDEIKCADIQ